MSISKRSFLTGVGAVTGAALVPFPALALVAPSSPLDHLKTRLMLAYVRDKMHEAARHVLFEYNNSMTRDAFSYMIMPSLETCRDVDLLWDYLIVCDETNNPEGCEEFVADVYVKPKKDDNRFIALNLIGVYEGAKFTEVVG